MIPVAQDEQIRSHVLKSMVQGSTIAGGVSEAQGHLCVICLDDISETAMTKPCAHEFDFVCIVNWLERNPTCPLCKTQILTVEYVQNSQQDTKVYTVNGRPPRSGANIAESPTSRGDQHHGQNSERQGQLETRPQIHAQGPINVTGDPLARRQHVYRHRLYSLHVGSNRLSRFQELTPKRFLHDTELVSRARKWIRRELRVFEFLLLPGEAAALDGPSNRQVNAEYLLEWIIAMLKSVNIKGSNGQAEDMLQEYLGRDNTRLFLHELRAWLRSPYSEMEEWDRTVQYDEMGISQNIDDMRASTSGSPRRRDWDVDHYTPYPNRRPPRT